MHEYSIVQALLDRVEQELRRKGASRAHLVQVRIGELAGVEVELLRTAYETIRRGTGCEHAPLEIAAMDARWECPRCGVHIPRGVALQCAACATPAHLVAGDEIMLERIEMEVG